MTPDGTKNKGGMYFTQFFGKDQRLVFEIQTTKPVTIEWLDIKGELRMLVGSELITLRLGQDQMLNEKSLYQLQIEQFKSTGE